MATSSSSGSNGAGGAGHSAGGSSHSPHSGGSSHGHSAGGSGHSQSSGGSSHGRNAGGGSQAHGSGGGAGGRRSSGAPGTSRAEAQGAAFTKVAVPCTGTLKLNLFPVSKLELTSAEPKTLTELQTELDLRGVCSNLPPRPTGFLIVSVKREPKDADAAAAPPASSGHGGRAKKAKKKGDGVENYSIPVELKFEQGENQAFEVQTPEGRKPVLHAVKHGLWGKGVVDVSLKVNVPHAPLAKLAPPLQFDNKLDVTLQVPPNPCIGCGIELTADVAPCFRGCDVIVEAYEKDVTSAEQAKAKIREISDDNDYHDLVEWTDDRKDPMTWRLGIRGRRAHGQLLWGDASEVGDLEIAYNLLLRTRGESETRSVLRGVDVVTVPKPRMETLDLQFCDGRAWGHFHVSGRISGLHPDCDLALEAQLYSFQEGKDSEAQHGDLMGAAATVQDNGEFSFDIGHILPWEVSNHRTHGLGFMVAIAPAREHRGPGTPFRSLFTCEVEGTRPLYHYLGRNNDPFVTSAICTRCQTLDGEVKKPPLRLLRDEIIAAFMSTPDYSAIERFLPFLQDSFGRYNLDTPLQLAHFLARSAVETGEFKAMTEQGDVDYSGRLGNHNPGDGKRYIGRGFIQLTGRDNYKACGRDLNQPFEEHPEMVAELKWAAESAAWFWATRGCRQAADADSIVGVIRAVNPGEKNITRHWKYLQIAYEAFAFPDRAARINRNLDEMRREGYTYNKEK